MQVGRHSTVRLPGERKEEAKTAATVSPLSIIYSIVKAAHQYLRLRTASKLIEDIKS